MIGVIDYRAGNITSVSRALSHLGRAHRVSGKPEELASSTHLIFPGVGAAGSAMATIRETGLADLIRDFVSSGRPTLGICLGCQIVLAASEEDDTPGLDLFPGIVKRFPGDMKTQARPLKIPHMGWNRVVFTRPSPLFAGIYPAGEFYFVHSYYPLPAEEDLVLGRTEYGISFCSVLGRGNLLAVQFHPEKSGPAGLKLLDNFCRWDGKDAL